MLELSVKNFKASIIKLFQQANSKSPETNGVGEHQRTQKICVSSKKDQMAFTELKNTKTKIKYSLDGLKSGDGSD